MLFRPHRRSRGPARRRCLDRSPLSVAPPAPRPAAHPPSLEAVPPLPFQRPPQPVRSLLEPLPDQQLRRNREQTDPEPGGPTPIRFRPQVVHAHRQVVHAHLLVARAHPRVARARRRPLPTGPPAGLVRRRRCCPEPVTSGPHLWPSASPLSPSARTTV